jgi:hypothetical protein
MSIVEIDFVKIPTEYFPSTHQRYIVNVPEGEVDFESTLWELSESSDNVAPIIYGGGDVILKIPHNASSTVFVKILSATVGNGLVVADAMYSKGRVAVAFALGTWTPPTT